MSTTTPATATAWTPFQSTNFTLQSFVPLIMAIAAILNFPEDVAADLVGFVESTVIGGIGFFGLLREFVKSGITFRWNSNVLTYVLTFVAGFAPWVMDYNFEAVLNGAINSIESGDFSLILAGLFNVGNILYKLINEKPWQTPDEPTGPTPGQLAAA